MASWLAAAVQAVSCKAQMGGRLRRIGVQGFGGLGFRGFEFRGQGFRMRV